MTYVNKCPAAKYCGGCRYQGKSYAEQLALKQQFVQSLYAGCPVEPIIGAADPYNYRNKVQFAFGSSRGRVIYGNYVPSTHQIVEIDDCQIAARQANAITADIRKLAVSFRLSIFDENSMAGFLRHVMVRTAHKTGQVMVILVAGTHVFPKKKDFIRELRKLHPEITTIILNVNSRHTSMVLGDKTEVLYGRGFIEDILCGKIFRISPASFYQINAEQTEKLYTEAIRLADLQKDEVLLDAYCGIGTIGIVASDSVREVIGVEINKIAIKDARINAELNDADNISFFCQDAGKFMVNTNRKIDAVIMDPARAGADEKFLSSLIRLKPKKIVYISCNPVTQKRDVRYLAGRGYEVQCVQPVDMFPFTEHIETVVLMSRKDT